MSDILFCNDDHKKYFYGLMDKYDISIKDDERAALFYILTITEDCRRNFLDCYNPETGGVKPNALNHGWVTSSDARAIRLAFNLFNDGVPTAWGKSTDKKDNLYNSRREFAYNGKELLNSTPCSIFCDYCIGKYLLEGVKLRFKWLF